MTVSEQIKGGLITNNPVLVQLIGMCPTLATSTSLTNGIGMGLSATAVLVCSNIVISLLRKIIPSKIRIAAYITIIAGFVTIIDLLLQAFIPSLAASLGLFIPLIVVNCIILGRAEAFASKNSVVPSAIDGLFMGLGFTLTLVILSVIRELLGAGTILGGAITVFSSPATIMILPAGGFLTLGCVIAVVQKLSKKGE
ncbi:MAG: electron transport complex subunit RsxE [Butyricicoccaceae bacterium]